jgi:hypothetical protein
MRKTLFIITILSSFSFPAMADKLDSTHQDWSVYSGDKSVCYVASQPIASDGNFKKRDEPYVLVNFKEGKPDEINVSSGYNYKADVDAEVTVENEKFKLYTEGETAWARDSAGDKAIVAAMKAGAKMKVKGISKKGSYSVDTYSLKGFSAAYKRMVELCKE